MPLSLRSRLAVVAAVVGLSTPFLHGADDKPNPIVTKVKAALKNPDKPFTILVHLKVKEGSEQMFEKAFAKAIEGTRKEKGSRAYDLARDVKVPGQYVVYERWQDVAALETHLKTKHITALLAEIGELLASPPDAEVFVPAGE